MPKMAFLPLLSEYQNLFSLKEQEIIWEMFKSNQKSKKPFKENLIKRDDTIEGFLLRELDCQTKLIKTRCGLGESTNVIFTSA